MPHQIPDIPFTGDQPVRVLFVQKDYDDEHHMAVGPVFVQTQAEVDASTPGHPAYVPPQPSKASEVGQPVTWVFESDAERIAEQRGLSLVVR